MGTPLGPKYIPYSYMDPLGSQEGLSPDHIDVAAATFGMDATEDKVGLCHLV